MNNIAKEYDLLAVSFLDVDSNSLRNISSLALSCYVLAFCTSFALCFVNRSNMVEISQTTILKALIERLWNIDEKSANELRQLMTSCKEVGSNLQSRTETKSYGFVDKESLFVYKSLVESVLDIQGDSKRVKDDEGQKSHLLQGIQSLSGIIRRWIEIPCSTPKYFFRVRPCIGAELFIFNAGSNSPDGLSITRGIQFPLNLCIQLKNASRVTEAGIAKIYCILAVKSSDRFIKQAHWGFRPRETDEMVELHDILLHHIRNESMENAGGFVTTCVYFELNQRGQGFSTCLLDVSALPEGLYPIKWHSSCVDKKGHHWSLLPLNHYPVLTIKKP